MNQKEELTMTCAYTTRVRSFALAAFLVGLGIVPIDIVLMEGQPVFRFPPDETDEAIDRFVDIKKRLAALEQAARPVRFAGSSKPARVTSGRTL
jgi:hypothetical protein